LSRSRFHLQIESFPNPYSQDFPICENPCHLTPEELSVHTIHDMDIVPSLSKPNRPDCELAGVECSGGGIEKLPAPTRKFRPSRPTEWTETYTGEMMACVKVVQARIQIWELQGKLENFATCEAIPSMLLA
jgi:hypothetical protein